MTERNREPFPSLIPYYLLNWGIVSPLLYAYFRGCVYGVEKIPKSGTYIIVCNHASNVDPPIIAVSARRPVSFMAKEELFSVPVIKTILPLCGAYPVKRKAQDISAIKSAIKFINQGWLAGIFLGGTRTVDGKIVDPKLGAALISAKTQTPIIPASIWGTAKVDQANNKGSFSPFKTPITVRFGDIIPPPSSKKKDELQAYTDRCCQIINEMHALGR